MMANEIIVELVKEKETKNTVRFQEQDQLNPILGVIYVPKVTLQKLGNPEVIKVTISA